MSSDVYRQLGVEPIINCATTYTRLGGSIMDPAVVQAMADAAACFVPIFDLQVAIGRRLAELTRNEAAYVSNGAAAGLALATAAAMAGADPALMARLPLDTEGMKNEVVVHREQRNWYDVAIRQVGARLVEIGHAMETLPWELEAAITDRTAAVFYFAGDHLNRHSLPLETVVEIAHRRGVPVIVDAAAQIPPISNLWRFTTELGADAAIFSGGKGLCGPQNSGLIVGRSDLIAAIRENGPPHQRIGRSMKMAKETMIGLMVAVERALERDAEADAAAWRATVDDWAAAWSSALPAGIDLRIDHHNEAGEPIPRVIVRFDPDLTPGRDHAIQRLRAGQPPIEVVLVDRHSIAFSPHLLQAGEAEIVRDRVIRLLAEASQPQQAAAR